MKYHDYLYDVGYNTPYPSGVYALVCVRSSQLYIGSSVNLTARSAQHFRSLEEGLHPNRNLQYCWDTHGASSFSFIVLEYVPDEDRLEEREQVWLDRLHKRSLNIQQTAHRPQWELVRPNQRWEVT